MDIKPLPPEDDPPRPGFRRPPPGGPSYPPPAPPGYGGTFLQSCLVAGCATVIAPLFLVGGLMVMLYFMISSGVNEASSALDNLYPSGKISGIREKLVREGASGAGTIAIIPIQGTINGDGSPLEGTGMLAVVSEQLRFAGEDDSVKAVLLQIDSPGGGLTASDQIYDEILKLRESGKVVMAWAGGVMASGGYYIAVGAEGVMASPTCTVGSIGVMLQYFQVVDLMQKLGVKFDPVTTGEHKDIGSPFREMTPREREMLQEYVDISHRRFVDLVAKHRDMETEEVAKLADGGIFDAETAMKRGLVDRVGYIADALAWTEEKVGEKNMRVVAYRRLPNLGDLFREAGRGASAAAVEAARTAPAPRAMAVWEGR